jgi:hypothetical protein
MVEGYRQVPEMVYFQKKFLLVHPMRISGYYPGKSFGRNP